MPGGTQVDRAYALVSTARVVSLIGDFARGRTWLDEADNLFDELADPEGQAIALGARCTLESRIGNYDEVFELAERLPASANPRTATTLPTPRRGLDCCPRPRRISAGRYLGAPSRTTTGRLPNAAERSLRHEQTPPLLRER